MFPNKQNVRRAWKCMRCPEDSAFIGQMFRVETHILREHLTPEFDSPFSCLLCKFACLKYKELETKLYPFKTNIILICHVFHLTCALAIVGMQLNF
jgi:hypothetical protein